MRLYDRRSNQLFDLTFLTADGDGITLKFLSRVANVRFDFERGIWEVEGEEIAENIMKAREIIEFRDYLIWEIGDLCALDALDDNMNKVFDNMDKALFEINKYRERMKGSDKS